MVKKSKLAAPLNLPDHQLNVIEMNCSGIMIVSNLLTIGSSTLGIY